MSGRAGSGRGRVFVSFFLFLFIDFFTLLSNEEILANPVGMVTSDFATLFGPGTMIEVGSREALGTGSGPVDASIDHALYETDSGFAIFLYQIHLHDPSHHVDEIEIDNDGIFSVDFVPFYDPGGNLAEIDPADPLMNLFYVLGDSGRAPIKAEEEIIHFEYKKFDGTTKHLEAGDKTVRVGGAFDVGYYKYALTKLENGGLKSAILPDGFGVAAPAGSSGIPIIPIPELPAGATVPVIALIGLGGWMIRKKVTQPIS